MVVVVHYFKLYLTCLCPIFLLSQPRLTAGCTHCVELLLTVLVQPTSRTNTLFKSYIWAERNGTSIPRQCLFDELARFFALSAPRLVCAPHVTGDDARPRACGPQRHTYHLSDAASCQTWRYGGNKTGRARRVRDSRSRATPTLFSLFCKLYPSEQAGQSSLYSQLDVCKLYRSRLAVR